MVIAGRSHARRRPGRASVLGLAALLAGATIAVARSARACDPGPATKVTVKASDAPACVAIPEMTLDSTFADVTLRARNGCDGELRLEGHECPTCGPPVVIAAGAEARFVLEPGASPSGGADYGEHRARTVAWAAGGRGGTVTAEVAVIDDPRACRGPEDDPSADARGCGGCGAPGGASGAAGGALLALGVALRILRRRAG